MFCVLPDRGTKHYLWKKETKPDRVSGFNYTNFSNIEVTKVCFDTAIFKMDNQQGPTVCTWNSAQCYAAAWMGKEFGYLDMSAESLHCSPETVTTLSINYTPIQNKKLKIYVLNCSRKIQLAKVHIEGGRRRGWQRMRWLDGITNSMHMSWVNSGSWWWTGRPGVLQSMESQRVRHDWANWTELNWYCGIYCRRVSSVWLGEWQGQQQLRICHKCRLSGQPETQKQHLINCPGNVYAS